MKILPCPCPEEQVADIRKYRSAYREQTYGVGCLCGRSGPVCNEAVDAIRAWNIMAVAEEAVEALRDVIFGCDCTNGSTTCVCCDRAYAIVLDKLKECGS